MTDEIRQFVQWVKDSNNIVFLEVPVYRQRVGYRIFEAWMDCIIRSMIIHRKRS